MIWVFCCFIWDIFKAKELLRRIDKEMNGFRAGRSTKKQIQIFNHRILCEKYYQQQKRLYHVFINSKKAFDSVLHAASSDATRKNTISENLVRTTEQATSAIQLRHSIGEWLRTIVGVNAMMSSVTHPPQILLNESKSGFFLFIFLWVG